MEKVTKLSAARKSSGIYQQEAADIIGVSLPTYRNAEQDNDLIRIGDIKKLVPHLNEVSVGIVHSLLDDIFLKSE